MSDVTKIDEVFTLTNDGPTFNWGTVLVKERKKKDGTGVTPATKYVVPVLENADDVKAFLSGLVDLAETIKSGNSTEWFHSLFNAEFHDAFKKTADENLAWDNEDLLKEIVSVARVSMVQDFAKLHKDLNDEFAFLQPLLKLGDLTPDMEAEVDLRREQAGLSSDDVLQRWAKYATQMATIRKQSLEAEERRLAAAKTRAENKAKKEAAEKAAKEAAAQVPTA